MFKPLHLLALLLTCSCLGQTFALNEKVNHLMNFHISLERSVPKGWSVEVKPVSLTKSSDDTATAQIHVFIYGAPSGTTFEQQIYPVGEDKPRSTLQGITAGANGMLVCAGRSPEQCGDPNRPDDPIEFTSNSRPGEPIRYGFVSSVGTVTFVVVPFPISAHDKQCTLSAVRLTPEFEAALITGTGYTPNTEVPYMTSPNGNFHTLAHSDERGVLRFGLVPFSQRGETSGRLAIKMKDPACSPELSYKWGN